MNIPSSSNNGGSPSYPSVPNAASHPVRSPPLSPMRPLTPGWLKPPPKPAPEYALGCTPAEYAWKGVVVPETGCPAKEDW